ncbi:unnamed protein product [Urochloa humidicola]
MGGLRRWHHLRDLHRAIKQAEPVLVSCVPTDNISNSWNGHINNDSMVPVGDSNSYHPDNAESCNMSTQEPGFVPKGSSLERFGQALS